MAQCNIAGKSRGDTVAMQGGTARSNLCGGVALLSAQRKYRADNDRCITCPKRRTLDKEFAILWRGIQNPDCLTAVSRLGLTCLPNFCRGEVTAATRARHAAAWLLAASSSSVIQADRR